MTLSSMALAQTTIQDIEAKSHDLLELVYGSLQSVKPPINLGQILKSVDITLKFGSFKDIRISGYYSKNNAATIYVAEDESYLRQAFTIAHELGHFLLHKHKKKDIFYRLDSLQLDQQEKRDEQEANWFAASLLMPRELVGMYWSVSHRIQEMASLFIVSQSAMTWRLKNIGLIE